VTGNRTLNANGPIFVASMSSPTRKHQALERSERLRSLGNWACGLGVAVFAVSLMVAGVLPSMNPKGTTSIYVALESSGHMRWLFMPLLGISVGLVAVGVVLNVIAGRKKSPP